MHQRMIHVFDRTNSTKKVGEINSTTTIMMLSSTATNSSEDDDGSVASELLPRTLFDQEQEPQQNSRSVRFSVVQVREFDRTVGEHPACKAGPPLTLGWSFVEGPDQWLMAHPNEINSDDDDGDDKKKIKRTLQQLYVPAERRIELLRDEWDISESELAAAMCVVAEIKASREKVVAEFRHMLAVKQKKAAVAARLDHGIDFPVTRVEC